MPPAMGNISVVDGVAMTSDIMKHILIGYNRHKSQAHALAYELARGTRSTMGLLTKIHSFVRSQIRYQLDPTGWQFIKSPSQTVYDGFGDCKSYSILIASLLRALGIRAAFRFISEQSDRVIRHIYVVAFINNREVVLDACLPALNQESGSITYKKDIHLL